MFENTHLAGSPDSTNAFAKTFRNSTPGGSVHREALKITEGQRSPLRPGRAGRGRGPRTPSRLERRSARAERSQMSTRILSKVGYHRCHGKGVVSDCLQVLKSVLEASVWTCTPYLLGHVARARLVSGHPTGLIRHGLAAAWPRNGRQPTQPGVKPIT